MNLLNTILTLSVLILALPFLGLPQIIDNVLYVLSALIIFISSYLLKKKLNDREVGTGNEI